MLSSAPPRGASGAHSRNSSSSSAIACVFPFVARVALGDGVKYVSELETLPTVMSFQPQLASRSVFGYYLDYIESIESIAMSLLFDRNFLPSMFSPSEYSPGRHVADHPSTKKGVDSIRCAPCPQGTYGHGDELRSARGPGESARGMAHAREDGRGAARVSRALAVSLRAAVGELDTREDVFPRTSVWRGDGVARRRGGRGGDSGGFSALVLELCDHVKLA